MVSTPTVGTRSVTQIDNLLDSLTKGVTEVVNVRVVVTTPKVKEV